MDNVLVLIHLQNKNKYTALILLQQSMNNRKLKCYFFNDGVTVAPVYGVHVTGIAIYRFYLL